MPDAHCQKFLEELTKLEAMIPPPPSKRPRCSAEEGGAGGTEEANANVNAESQENWQEQGTRSAGSASEAAPFENPFYVPEAGEGEGVATAEREAGEGKDPRESECTETVAVSAAAMGRLMASDDFEEEMEDLTGLPVQIQVPAGEGMPGEVVVGPGHRSDVAGAVCLVQERLQEMESPEEPHEDDEEGKVEAEVANEDGEDMGAEDDVPLALALMDAQEDEGTTEFWDLQM